MMTQVNQDVFLFINSFAGTSEVVDMIFLLLANGAGIVLMFFTLSFIYKNESGWGILKSGALVFAPALAAVVYSEVLKQLFLAPRPYLVLEQLNILYEHGGMDSFPSSHATVYMALAVSAYLYSKKLGSVIFVFAVLIGLSRIFVGVHWPVDILMGFVVGASVSYVMYLIINKFVSKTK